MCRHDRLHSRCCRARGFLGHEDGDLIGVSPEEWQRWKESGWRRTDGLNHVAGGLISWTDQI